MKKPNLVSYLSVVVALVLAGQAFLGSPRRAIALDSVNVHTKDGGSFSGEVDARTNDKFLTLRSTSPSAVMRIEIPWSTVSQIGHADREFTAEEFRPVSEELKSDLPDDFFTTRAAEHPADSEAAPNSVSLRSSREVTSILIEAQAADWDADVELDGLELRVIPLASDGAVIPVEGVIRARLVGPDYGSHARAFREIGRWNQKVRSTDHEDLWGTLYRLPFRTINPEFDMRSGPHGILTVQLDVRGNGTFAASQQVRVRTQSSVRDQLQLLEHRRFFPHERVSWRDW